MTQKLFKRTVFPLILTAYAFLCQSGAYAVARMIAGGWEKTDITTSLDRLIPFVPWTVAIYFGCYLFWIANYFLCAQGERNERARFFAADTIAKAICFVIFLLFPTTNVRPDVGGDGIWNELMRLLYSIDSPDNLFPSMHCLMGWFCWVGVRKRRDIPLWYKWFSLLGALAVCVSTLTTYQHVIADVIGGVLLSEICYCIANIDRIRKIAALGIEWLYRNAGKILRVSAADT